MADPLLLGIEIGGTKLQLGLGHADGRLLAFQRLAVDEPGRTTRATAENIREQIDAALDPLLGQIDACRADVSAVGVGFGGPVDSDRGILIQSLQRLGWDQFPLGDWLRERLPGAKVLIHNDAATAALGESQFGAGVGFSPLVYVTIGSGVGGGLIVDGQIYRGSGRGSMEIGHLWTDQKAVFEKGNYRDLPDPRTARAQATVEDLVAGWNLAALAWFRLWNRLHTDPQYTSPLRTLIDPRKDYRSVTCEMVAQAARQGDQDALWVLRRATRTLGKALAHVVTLLAPRRIILGGGVSLIGEHLWAQPVRNALDRHVFPPFRGTYDLVTAALGEQVVVYGAIALARQALT